MMNFKKINDISGWSVFLLTLIAYIFTVEQTASFWDSGEFIAISYKLEVSHPPGAPLFMLIGRLFSFLAFGDVTRVAFWINMVSVVASALTVLFLFWTIIMAGRKLIGAVKGQETPIQTILLIGAGAIGALSFAFTDSFWFSAVEGEVYAMSSFFTAFVFWAMLKWELVEDESQANKWIILIAYMLGLSIGVHLLGLVTLPALGLIYYFKKYKKVTKWGILATLGLSGFFIILINNFLIPGLPTLAGKFEITFVNSFGLPFGSGALFMTALFISALVFGIRYTIKHGYVNLNTILVSLTFILIGYASYGVILVRSNANPPIDQNNPENVMTFVSYLLREQYGDRPLLYGKYFTAQQVSNERGKPVYAKGEDKYEIVDYKVNVEYDKENQGFMPRMWRNTPGDVAKYREVTGLRQGEKPSFIDNMAFMFSHQIGHMYMRYFLFNFSGRESDIQNADWRGPLDNDKGVPEVIKQNKGRNQYFMIPLILGLVGFFFQFNRDNKGFFATLMFFLLTGVALVVYLNSPAIEPRERDYIYAGSYYVFAIWIGFSVLAIGRLLMNRGKAGVYAAIVLCTASPLILASENWDDHDRSNRYFSVDSARNFLASCAPNAILFTGGDNDTFPLWYVQEVEGFRTDVRVVVLSYYQTDWYIDQTAVKMNDSEAFPYTLTQDNYRQGTNDILIISPDPQFEGQAVSLKEYISLIKNKSKMLEREYASGDKVNIVPAETFMLDVDTAMVKAKGIIPQKLEPYLTNRMYVTMKEGKTYLDKGQMMILDMIGENNWERPIYFNYTSVNSLNFDIERYLVQEGMTSRLLPIERPPGQPDLVDTETMYKNIKDKFAWRGLDDPKANLNEDYRQFVQNSRSIITTLADALIAEGDSVRAKEILDLGMRVMPRASLPYDIPSVGFVKGYLDIGEDDIALALAMEMAEEFNSMVNYHQEKLRYDYDFQKYYRSLYSLDQILRMSGKTEAADKVRKMIDEQTVKFPAELRNTL
jgi:hypothetical protein